MTATATVEKVEVVPYLHRYGSEQVSNPQIGDQAWFDMAFGGFRELRTFTTERIWAPDPDSQDSGI